MAPGKGSHRRQRPTSMASNLLSGQVRNIARRRHRCRQRRCCRTLAGEVRRHRVDVVGEILPGAGGTGDLGTTLRETAHGCNPRYNSIKCAVGLGRYRRCIRSSGSKISPFRLRRSPPLSSPSMFTVLRKVRTVMSGRYRQSAVPATLLSIPPLFSNSAPSDLTPLQDAYGGDHLSICIVLEPTSMISTEDPRPTMACQQCGETVRSSRRDLVKPHSDRHTVRSHWAALSTVKWGSPRTSTDAAFGGHSSILPGNAGSSSVESADPFRVLASWAGLLKLLVKPRRAFSHFRRGLLFDRPSC